jgi:hypothetical protein
MKDVPTKKSSFYFVIFNPFVHISALKMVKELTRHDTAISQKMKALNFSNFNAIFSIDKAKKSNLTFISERRK